MVTFTFNGEARSLDVDPDMPLFGRSATCSG